MFCLRNFNYVNDKEVKEDIDHNNFKNKTLLSKLNTKIS